MFTTLVRLVLVGFLIAPLAHGAERPFSTDKARSINAGDVSEIVDAHIAAELDWRSYYLNRPRIVANDSAAIDRPHIEAVPGD